MTTVLVAGRLAMIATLVLWAAGNVFAQSYPARPVKIVVPFAAGGAVDILVRILGQKISESWGHQILVENRTGAGGNIGAELVAKSAPDGYTYLAHSQAFAVNISLQKDQPYHPVKDFSPVMLIASTNGVLQVPPSLAVQSVKDLIALAKSQPGKLSYGSSGIGTSSHLNMELFKILVGIDVVHIPYKVLAQAQNDLMSGRTQLYIGPLPGVVHHIRSGKIRALAVSGSRRSEALPDLPTLQEAGVPGYEAVTWYGMYAPIGTPRDAVTRTHAELAQALQKPEVKEKFVALGLDRVGSTPEFLAKYLQDEVTKWAGVVKAIGMKAE